MKLASNPWGIHDDHAPALDAFVRLGTLQAVAMELRISEKAIEARLRTARRLMGVDNRVLLALKWADWQRTVANACKAQDRVTEPCAACAGMGFKVRRAG